MEERRFERLGASFGIAFAVLLLATVFWAPAPPHVDDDVNTIANYFTDNRTRVLTATMLNTFAGLSFLMFVGHLRHVLARAEHGAEALAPVVMLSGVALPVIAMITVLPAGALAFLGDQGMLGDEGLTLALNDMLYLCNGLIGLTAAVFLASTGLAMVSGELVEPWLGYAGLALSAVFVVGGIASFYVTTYSAFWSGVLIVATLGFALWTFAAGALMLMHPEQERAAQRTSLLLPTGA